MTTHKCPECGEQHFQIVARQMVDVRFDKDGEHEITDGPYGDIDWDDEAFAMCNKCGWGGTLRQAIYEEGIEPTKVRDGTARAGDTVWWSAEDGPEKFVFGYNNETRAHLRNMHEYPRAYSLAEPRYKIIYEHTEES